MENWGAGSVRPLSKGRARRLNSAADKIPIPIQCLIGQWMPCDDDVGGDQVIAAETRPQIRMFAQDSLKVEQMPILAVCSNTRTGLTCTERPCSRTDVIQVRKRSLQEITSAIAELLTDSLTGFRNVFETRAEFGRHKCGNFAADFTAGVGNIYDPVGFAIPENSPTDVGVEFSAKAKEFRHFSFGGHRTS